MIIIIKANTRASRKFTSA